MPPTAVTPNPSSFVSSLSLSSGAGGNENNGSGQDGCPCWRREPLLDQAASSPFFFPFFLSTTFTTPDKEASSSGRPTTMSQRWKTSATVGPFAGARAHRWLSVVPSKGTAVVPIFGWISGVNCRASALPKGDVELV